VNLPLEFAICECGFSLRGRDKIHVLTHFVGELYTMEGSKSL